MQVTAEKEEPPFKPRVRDITDVKNFSPNFTVTVMCGVVVGEEGRERKERLLFVTLCSLHE